MLNNDVVRNEHEMIFSIKMQNFKFFECSNEVVSKLEKFGDNEFENDKNERKNKKYVS